MDEVEQLAIDRLKELFGAEWANVQPHSGAQANAAVMLGVIILNVPFTLGMAIGLPLVLIGSYFASRKVTTSVQ